jgi:hypothetical protein
MSYLGYNDMAGNVLVLDNNGMADPIIETLESALGYTFNVARELKVATDYMKEINFNAAVVNPFPDYGKLKGAYIDLVKGDLKKKRIPVMVYSRMSIEKLAQGAGLDLDLVLGRDYMLYLRKPSPVEVIADRLRELLGNR